MRRTWEEAAKCISYVQNDLFLIIWKTFIVHCSHARAAPLQNSGLIDWLESADILDDEPR